MKKTPFLILLIAGLCGNLYAADEADNNPAYAQARQNYRQYLQQLKALNQQYKQVTGEMKKVIQEEGLPTWEDPDLGFGSWAWAEPQIDNSYKNMVVTAEMPGLNKNSIRVSLEDHKTLKITADKKTKQGSEPVQKTVGLPAEGLERGTKAKYEDGILTITIPKAVETANEVSVPVQ